MTMTPLPSPPSTSDPANFATKADALLAALPNFVTEANALSNGLNFPGLMANSTTSVAIGTGSKSFTIDTGKTFVAGQSIMVQYTTTPTNWMYGTVTSYNSGTGALVMNVTSVLGSGTWALWTVSLAMPLVSSLGFSMSGGINEGRGTVAMHATTMDLWSQPNIIDGTGSAVTITAIVNAPQAGGRRTLYPITGTVITHGATFSVDGNVSYTTLAGDALVFEAVTVSTFNVGIIKQDGTAVAIVVATAAEVLTGTNNTKIVTPLAAQAFRSALGTPQATTSGTAKGFTGIPSWAKKITMTFSGVSTNGTSYPIIQIGPVGGYENTGYSGSSGRGYQSAGFVDAIFTTGIGICSGAASYILDGSVTFTLLDASTNTWVAAGVLGQPDNAGTIITGGSKSLAGVLDRIQLTTVNGTDAFDAGKINILYE